MPIPVRFFAAVAKDVADVSRVDATQFALAVDALKQATGFLGSSRALSLISEHVPVKSSAEAIRNLVFALHDWVNEQGATLDRLSESFKAALEKDEDSQAELDESRFDQCLRQLAGPFSAIERQADATRVAGMAGNRFKRVSFVSDLRPIFRKPNRDEIEGFIPLTTMVVHSEDPSENEQRMELVISLSELEAIAEEATKALAKLKLLSDFSARSGVEIPDLELTRTPTKKPIPNE